MADVKLRYGQGLETLRIPDKNLVQEVQPRKEQASKDVSGIVRRALETPIGLTLEDTIRNRRVCILVEDGTRSEPQEVLIDELARNMGPAKELTFIVATGSHETDSARNRQITKAINTSCQTHKLRKYQVLVHDAHQSAAHLLGKTRRGTPVYVNTAALEQEAFVIAADMKNHYFAGYSNPVKDFLPGICAFATIEANHSLALDPNSTFGRHPFHPDAARRNNPLAEDMVEAMNLILAGRPAFVLATITSGPYILWAGSGDLAKVTTQGVRKIDDTASFTLTPTDRIILSPGGFPEDESLYNAQRGLELTKNAVRDGGEILFLAECAKGVAPTPDARAHFFDYLTQPLPKVFASIKKKYKLYTHKAYKFAELIQRVSHIWMHTALDPAQVTAAHLDFAPDAQRVVDGWLRSDPGTQILVFHDANKIAVYAG
jgi:nickel-dependent lactate racemase